MLLLLKFSEHLKFDNNLFVSFVHRQRALSGKGNVVENSKRVRGRDRGDRAVPAPEANAELQVNLDVSRISFSFNVSNCIDIFC